MIFARICTAVEHTAEDLRPGATVHSVILQKELVEVMALLDLAKERTSQAELALRQARRAFEMARYPESHREEAGQLMDQAAAVAKKFRPASGAGAGCGTRASIRRRLVAGELAGDAPAAERCRDQLAACEALLGKERLKRERRLSRIRLVAGRFERKLEALRGV